MAPSTVPGIPRQVADLDARMFCALTGRSDVTVVQINDVEHGTSIRARIGITGSSDLPQRAFVKLAPTRPAEYLLNRYMGLAHTEAGIYRRLNTELDSIIPKVFGAQSDPHGGRSVVIMEDLTERNARFLSVAAGCPAADALAVAATLGSLHRRFWMSDRLHTGDLIDLSPALSRSTSRGPRSWPLLRMIPRIFHDVVPADFRDQASILVTQRWSVARLIRTYPHTLIHGDTHAGNICVIGDRHDHIVPIEENALKVEERYKTLGGEIEVIRKPNGGHRPHSLPDPAPIVDFVVKHAGAPRQPEPAAAEPAATP
jgi:hypothetical protein